MKDAATIVKGLTSGKTAYSLRNGNATIVTGLVLGIVGGIVISKFTGGCKICSAFWGGVAGTGAGIYIHAKKSTQ